MTNAEADNLITTLPKPGGLQLTRKGDWIEMSGGKSGGHAISVSASSGERLLVHWKGYVESQGLSLGPDYTTKPASPSAPRVGQRVEVSSKSENQGPSLGPEYATTKPSSPSGLRVGQWVEFPSKSATSGWRRGQVVKVTPKRALIAYRFNYERKYDQEHGIKFDPATARTAWRKLTEIKFK